MKYFSIDTLTPANLSKGDNTVLISYTASVANTNDNPVALTFAVNGDINVAFVENGIEKSFVTWLETMTTVDISYQKEVTIRILNTPGSSPCSLTLTAKDINHNPVDSPTSITYA